MKNDFYSVPAITTPVVHYFSYQIYFLFRTQCRQGDEIIQEPTQLAVQEAEHSEGYAQIENKRLFRLSLKQVAPLTRQQLHYFLQSSWQSLYRQYEQCLVYPVAEGQISYRNASEHLLMGVALLVIGKQFDQLQPPALPLRDQQQRPLGHMVFMPQAQPLFTIRDSADKKTLASQVIAFKPYYTQPSAIHGLHGHQWQLHFSHSEYPCLQPFQLEATQPIFAVYGLQHVEKTSRLEQLEDFLLYGQNETHRAALLQLLTPLLMCQWQLAQVETRIQYTLKRLQPYTDDYRYQTDMMLSTKSLEVLYTEVQAMNTLIAETQYNLGQVQQTIKTLEINAALLTRYLDKIRQIAYNRHWNIDWHFQADCRTELLFLDYSIPEDNPLTLWTVFSDNTEMLTHKYNEIHYKFKYLERIHQRWYAVLEQKRQRRSEQLTAMGYSLIFLMLLMALAQIFNAHRQLPQLDKPAWLHWLDNFYIIDIIQYLLDSPILFITAALLPLGYQFWKMRKV